MIVALATILSAQTLAYSVGDGSSQNPYQITNCAELQDMGLDLSAHYILMNDIDCSDTIDWNDGAGFEPVGTASTPFIGTFDGQNHTITGLYINRSSTNYVGLFGYIDSGASVSNVGLEDVNINGSSNVGGLVGYNTGAGTITNSYATGDVSGSGSVGGLVGINDNGAITNSYATGSVAGGRFVGGLIGVTGNPSLEYWGTITNSYATGDVSVSDNIDSLIRFAGGLVGYNWGRGTITNSYATGDVSVSDNIDSLITYAGGLVAYNRATGAIKNSYATGDVSSDNIDSLIRYAGGLIGFNWGTITNSYATGNVSGSRVGGLVGSNRGTITNSWFEVDGPSAFYASTHAVYTGFPSWDFVDIWGIDDGVSYPYLQWNTPPVADAGPDQTVECTSSSGASVTLDGSGSSDENGDPLTYTWTGEFGIAMGATPTVTIPCGNSNIVNLVVNDGTFDSEPDTVMITVVDTTPPAIIAPDNVSVEQTSSSGTPVTLGTPIVSDICDTNPVVTNDAPALFPQGDTTVTWTATDASGNSNTATQTVTVSDTTAPAVTAKLVPVKLKKKKGYFRVEFSATDIIDTDPTIVALLNDDVSVTNGQLVMLKYKKKFKVKTSDDGSSDDRRKKLKKHHGDDGSSDDGKNNKKNKKMKKHHGDDGSSDDDSSSDDSSDGRHACGDIKLAGPSFTLEVMATDDAGNVGAAIDIYFFDTSNKKDDDGDGYANNQGDCDDTDPTIGPDAQEICDGIDNNCDGQIDEPVISFTSPADGSTINSSSTLVRGTINTCSQEVGIMVNGVPAEIAGSEFAANDIFLEIGSNTLTAVATDKDGNTATGTITVYTMLYQDQVTLSSNITSGLSPLDVKFSIDTQISNQITTYEMDFEGDGTQDQTITDLDNVSFTYEQEGLYYPTITVTDDQGYWYTDTIAINVLSLDEMDALLKAKWEDFGAALINSNIEGALELFEENSREIYREQFTELSSILNTIGNELGYLRLVAIGDNRAEYEIIVTREGVTYSYYLLFVRDKDGLWKIRAF